MPNRINVHHPDLLACETCQAVVCPVRLTTPASPGINPAGSLTSRQGVQVCREGFSVDGGTGPTDDEAWAWPVL
jgi:hypothetical protein